MPWRFNGNATVNPDSPEAFAICDRCDRQFNRTALRFQMEFRGNRLMNIRLLVCDECYDKPFQHFRPIVLPPDPEPILNPRPFNYALANEGQPAATFSTPPTLGTGLPIADD